MVSHDKIFVTRYFRGTWPSVEMLKGCMIGENLGTSVLEGLTSDQHDTCSHPIQRKRYGNTET